MAGYTGAAGTNQGSWNGNGGSLGLTTGNRWAGNTAFGPSGGMASGYGTRDGVSLAAASMGPSIGNYSNFNNLNGTPMFNGALSGQSFRAPNANAAYGQAMAAYQHMQHPPGGGMTPASGGPPTISQPLPPMQQPPLPSYQPYTPAVDGSWLSQMFGPQKYNPASSPGYNAYTSVYKTGPASPITGETTVQQNWPGGVGPGGNWSVRPGGDTGYGR